MAQRVSQRRGDQSATGGVPAVNVARTRRRGFIREFLAVLVGGVVALFPLAAGLAVFLDPLRARGKYGGGFVKVAMLDGLLVGKPRRVTVVDDRIDAWNLYPKEPIGAVYLLRSADNKVLALHSRCPHAGCLVDYNPDLNLYQCPCHRSSFELTGRIHNPQSPSPRGLDSLDVELRTTRSGTEVWVRFQNFVGATKEKIPIA